MPFIEIVGPDRGDAQRARLSERLTASLAEAFGIERDIITIYYFPVAPRDHAHAGVSTPPDAIRNFLKVHGFERDRSIKRLAARRMTDAFVEATQVDPKNVVVYFLDRDREDVAHGGILACD